MRKLLLASASVLLLSTGAALADSSGNVQEIDQIGVNQNAVQEIFNDSGDNFQHAEQRVDNNDSFQHINNNSDDNDQFILQNGNSQNDADQTINQDANGNTQNAYQTGFQNTSTQLIVSGDTNWQQVDQVGDHNVANQHIN